jgi:hypothetical protein
MGRSVNSGAKTKRGGRWGGARGAADAMGRGEMSGRWGGARGASQSKRGAVDGVGRDERLMGRGEMSGRWAGAR